MSDEYGIHHRHYHTDGTGWFVGIIVGLALLAIGYLIFSAERPEELSADQVRCMIANSGSDCVQITRWEPQKP